MNKIRMEKENEVFKSSLYLENLPKSTVVYPVDDQILDILLNEELGHLCLLKKIMKKEGIGKGDFHNYKSKLSILSKELDAFKLPDEDIKQAVTGFSIKRTQRIRDDNCLLHSMAITPVILTKHNRKK